MGRPECRRCRPGSGDRGGERGSAIPFVKYHGRKRTAIAWRESHGAPASFRATRGRPRRAPAAQQAAAARPGRGGDPSHFPLPTSHILRGAAGLGPREQRPPAAVAPLQIHADAARPHLVVPDPRREPVPAVTQPAHPGVVQRRRPWRAPAQGGPARRNGPARAQAGAGHLWRLMRRPRHQIIPRPVRVVSAVARFARYTGRSDPRAGSSSAGGGRRAAGLPPWPSSSAIAPRAAQKYALA